MPSLEVFSPGCKARSLLPLFHWSILGATCPCSAAEDMVWYKESSSRLDLFRFVVSVH